MAGKIINSNDREKILIALLAIVEEATNRRGLINAWRVGKVCFTDDQRRLDTLTAACAIQNADLGFTPTLRPLKGGKPNA